MGKMQAQSAHMVACNRFHSVLERCALTLLLLRDRTESDVLPLTHDVLSDMLGVHRPAATITLTVLEESGAIAKAGRGRIEISSEQQLRASSCECYDQLRPASA